MKLKNFLIVISFFVGCMQVQAEVLPKTFYSDAEIASDVDGFTLYKIPSNTITYNKIFGEEVSNIIESDQLSSTKRADPVWMFDVMAMDYYGDITVGEYVGSEINHALIFCITRNVNNVRLLASAKGGRESWALKSPYVSAEKGCYAGIVDTRSYSKSGRYYFKGTAQVKGYKLTNYNTDSFKYWIVNY